MSATPEIGREQTTNEMIRRLTQAQEKGETVQVTLKDGTMRWGRAVDISATAFSLSSPAANGSDMRVSLRYDQVTFVRYESGRNRFVRSLIDLVTAPIVIPVFIIWGLQGHTC